MRNHHQYTINQYRIATDRSILSALFCMDFYLLIIRFLTDVVVNAKSCLNSNQRFDSYNDRFFGSIF